MSDRSQAASGKFGFTKTILFVEGEKRLRQSISLWLRTSGYHLLVASGGLEALQLALEFKGPIHLLLANVEMPDMTGIELVQQLNQERPDTKNFLVSDLASGMLLLDQGWQFLPTPFRADMLRTRIRDLLSEPQTIPGRHWPNEDAMSGQESLTKREIQVLSLIARGNSTKQAAGILGIAFKTCVGHRSRLMKKLSIHDSTTLVRYAIRAGLIDP